MSFLSSQGQLINASSFTVPVSAGGAVSGTEDELYTSGTFVYPAGWYLASFTTTLAGTAIASGYIQFQLGGNDVAQIQIFGAGTYTLTAPVYLSGPDVFSIDASTTGTGGTNWTSTAGNLYLVRMS